MNNNLYSVKILSFCLKEEPQTKGRRAACGSRAALCPPLSYMIECNGSLNKIYIPGAVAS